MKTTLIRGVAAGAVGTATLDALTYLDMAVTGRPASDAPGQTALAAADRVGVDLPASGGRPEAYGALAGIGTGLGVGVVAAAARRLGVRLPLLAEAAVIGVGAMVAADGPMQWSGVSDLATWTTADWTRDVLPHLAFGLATATTLRGLDPGADDVDESAEPLRSRPAVLARGFAVGVATGARSSLGLVPPALGSGRTGVLVGAAGLVASELTVDKLPAAGARIERGPYAARVALGALGAAVVARRQRSGALLPAVAGAVGAAAGTLAGWALREVAAERGWATQAALLEDAAALGLTAWASRR